MHKHLRAIRQPGKGYSLTRCSMREGRMRGLDVVWVIGILAGMVLFAGCLQGPGGEEANGTLQGKVTIGPICPVERPNVTCEPPPEAYAARKVVVYKEDGVSQVKVVDIDAKGSYRTILPVGTYVVDINHLGIDRSGDVPTTVTIRNGETVTLNIDIDTGIR